MYECYLCERKGLSRHQTDVYFGNTESEPHRICHRCVLRATAALIDSKIRVRRDDVKETNMPKLKGTLNVQDLRPDVQKDVMDYFLENKIQWTSLSEMPVEEALNAYLSWNGIIGYNDKIINIFECGQ